MTSSNEKQLYDVPSNIFIHVVYTTDIKTGNYIKKYNNNTYIKVFSEEISFNFSDKLYIALEDLCKEEFEIDVRTRNLIGLCEVSEIKNIQYNN